jgi:hypothetical protein
VRKVARAPAITKRAERVSAALCQDAWRSRAAESPPRSHLKEQRGSSPEREIASFLRALLRSHLARALEITSGPTACPRSKATTKSEKLPSPPPERQMLASKSVSRLDGPAQRETRQSLGPFSWQSGALQLAARSTASSRAIGRRRRARHGPHPARTGTVITPLPPLTQCVAAHLWVRRPRR